MYVRKQSQANKEKLLRQSSEMAHIANLSSFESHTSTRFCYWKLEQRWPKVKSTFNWLNINKMHGCGFVWQSACSDVVGIQQYTFNTLQMGGAFSTHSRVFLHCAQWSGCALPQTTLAHELKMKHLFSKCTVYNYASVSLLLAMLYLSSPGFLWASQPLRSTCETPCCLLAPPLLASKWLTLKATSLCSAKHNLPANFHQYLPFADFNGFFGSSHSFCSYPRCWVRVKLEIQQHPLQH